MTKDIRDPLPSKENIKNLLKYLSIFNKPGYSPGKPRYEKKGNSVTLWPYCYNEATEGFMNSCYKEGFMYSYDWSEYSEKAKEIQSRKPPYAYILGAGKSQPDEIENKLLNFTEPLLRVLQNELQEK
jgi:hypothetical protein